MKAGRRRRVVAAAALASIVAAWPAIAGNQSISDSEGDTKALKDKPYLDIVSARAGHAIGGRLKHKITMAAPVKEAKPNTRPFILINTRGHDSSDFEYLVLGRRVFKVSEKDEFEKTGAAKITARKRTWVYFFEPKTFGNPKTYGWAALTSMGDTVDLAPNRKYVEHATRP